MTALRIPVSEAAPVGGYANLLFHIVPSDVSFDQAKVAADLLGLKVEAVTEPLYSGNYDDGNETVVFTNVTLDEVEQLMSQESGYIASRVAMLQEGEERSLWEALLRGRCDEILENDEEGTEMDEADLIEGSLHISVSLEVDELAEA